MAESYNLHHCHPPELVGWNDSSEPHATLHGPANRVGVKNKRKAHVIVRTLNLALKLAYFMFMCVKMSSSFASWIETFSLDFLSC